MVEFGSERAFFSQTFKVRTHATNYFWKNFHVNERGIPNNHMKISIN